jgi:type III pantothenate kinase
MSILLIDIGNTRMKWAVVEDQKNISQMIFTSQGSFSENLSSSTIELCLKNSWKIEQIICSSVISIEQTNSLQTAFKETYPNTLWKQMDGLALIEKIGTSYLSPAQLGSDRRAMIIAAQTLYPQKNILIVSAGTATTIDMITAQAHHLGGWILPGVSLMRDSLMQGTGRLAIDSSVIENEFPVEIGIDTQSSINQGVLASQLGSIEIAKRYAERKNIQLDLILLSGGNGKQLLNHQEHSDQIIKSHYEDNLVLKGLMVWCQSN